MATWDPSRYLRYADERSRPFVELVTRVEGDPRTIVDLGCGPGHLTAVLRSRWPDATVLGVDSSPEMIERARADADDDRVSYELADVATWEPDEPVDLIISNALFQWVPDQLAVIERLGRHVAAHGTFALQTPNNYAAPSHRLLAEIASRPAYRELTDGLHDDRGTAAGAYLALFSRLGWSADAWETTYLHVLQGEDPVLDWISGTGARPVLEALPDALRAEFVAEYGAALREAYPAKPWGTVLPFTRVFTVARRGA
ncbi:MAG: methyltransferase domain-containing protein [Aeromicrobium sp.]